ncbi:tetratricopeptide repeat protein [Phototrophicus methaneseepsis]|uniref:Tetratricopeptide repeat protein n=1 Tax=Phototrophicus methaneseepsis TaxID=2710758 RepID=A0A7S8EAP4_9CHLR|nr:tetratricopeptide repeat protein [Phototrophicus methaneseepsis]QPC83471.1 tetratricopeptide repeat protein [Phototrophicus methaneseepsis]
MQIKRNYNEPFFRERLIRKKQRRLALRRNLLLLVLVFGSLTFFTMTQPGLVTEATYAVLGIQATPTPLPSSLAAQAQELYYQGQIEEAADLLEQAIEQRPDTIDYLYEYGMLLLDLERSQEAQEIAERIGEIDANDVRGFALKARALVWLDQSPTAIPIARAGLQINPNFPALYETLSWAYTATSDWQQGIDYGELAIETAPGDVRAYWAYSNALAAVGSYAEAEQILQEALAVHPYYLPPYFQLAFLYMAQDRDQEAIDLYNRVIGLEPRNAQAMLRLCQAYRKVGEFQRAMGMCQDAVNLNPADASAQFQLAMLRYSNREFRPALAAFEACNELDPSILGCHYRMGLSYYYVAREAIQVCQTNPADPLCESTYRTQGCQLAWDTLEDSLIMAQAQNSEQASVDDIRTGLDAVLRDPLCAGVSGTLPFVTTPTPESEALPGDTTGEAASDATAVDEMTTDEMATDEMVVDEAVATTEP